MNQLHPSNSRSITAAAWSVAASSWARAARPVPTPRRGDPHVAVPPGRLLAAHERLEIRALLLPGDPDEVEVPGVVQRPQHPPDPRAVPAPPDTRYASLGGSWCGAAPRRRCGRAPERGVEDGTDRSGAPAAAPGATSAGGSPAAAAASSCPSCFRRPARVGEGAARASPAFVRGGSPEPYELLVVTPRIRI